MLSTLANNGTRRTPALHSNYVLVVDDSSVARMVLRNTLRRDGFEVVTAHDAREALTAVARRRPSLVLTDVDMPDLDGFELLSSLTHSCPKLPVVLISVDVDIEARVRAAELGAAAIVRKSSDPELLVDLVRHFMANP